MRALLTESVAEAPVKKGKRWRVVVARPGQGSSGNYSPELLRDFGPAALPAGTKAYFDHDPKRSIKDMVGSYPDGTYWDEANQELVAELQPFKHWQDVIDEVGPLAEASIRVQGTKDEDGNVLELFPSRANSIDLVGAAGLEGSGLREQVESLVESARLLDSTEEPGVETSAQEKEDQKMEEKLDKLIALFESFVTASTAKTVEKVQAEADADALAEAAKDAVESYDSKTALIEAARENLFPSQIAALRKAAKEGADIQPLLEDATKTFEEAREVLSESFEDAGRSLKSGTVQDATDLGKVFG